jgi:hypothetical protein
MSDSFFTQGSSHKICQDYATHGPDYAIVSDGCSTAVDSDFGARLLTLAAAAALNAGMEIGTESFYGWVLDRAATYAQALDLPLDCLFATLVIAQKTDNKIVVTMKGDGVIVAKYPDNLLHVIYLEFPYSAPFFLSYHLDEASIENYRKNVGNTCTKHELIISSSSITEARKELTLPLRSPCLLKEEFVDAEAVAIMSDGVLSFVKLEQTATQKQTVRIDEAEVIREFMTFKDYNGEFVQRR